MKQAIITLIPKKADLQRLHTILEINISPLCELQNPN